MTSDALPLASHIFPTFCQLVRSLEISYAGGSEETPGGRHYRRESAGEGLSTPVPDKLFVLLLTCLHVHLVLGTCQESKAFELG